jgi:DNA-directed RNA polymerase specialized sigma24 family protein
MKLYSTIDEIVKDDKRWRKRALKVTKSNEVQADEILHTFYHYYIEMTNPPVINYTYIYQALINNYIQLKMKLDKIIEYDETLYAAVNIDHYDYDDTDDLYNDNLYKCVILDIEHLDYFSKTLFKLNMIDGLSIREIQKEYGLSYSTIQQSIFTTKQILKNKYTDNEQKN